MTSSSSCPSSHLLRDLHRFPTREHTGNVLTWVTKTQPYRETSCTGVWNMVTQMLLLMLSLSKAENQSSGTLCYPSCLFLSNSFSISLISMWTIAFHPKLPLFHLPTSLPLPGWTHCIMNARQVPVFTLSITTSSCGSISIIMKSKDFS